jgi:hypothetical protein
VRAVRSSGGKVMENFPAQSSSDVLLLKRSPAEEQPLRPTFGFKSPTIKVSPRWKDRMKLSTEDCLIVSNPIEDYAVPPPNV